MVCGLFLLIPAFLIVDPARMLQLRNEMASDSGRAKRGVRSAAAGNDPPEFHRASAHRVFACNQPQGEPPVSRILIAAAAVSMLVSVPAFAQMGADKMASDKMAMDSMSCQQMMDKGNTSMDSMADGSKKTMMMKQMDMAKMSMSSGKEADCKMHMKKAMGM
jgi:uncharacterized membrane protein (DUF106 family)